MSTIGKINAIISVSSAPLTSGLSRASSAIAGFGSNIVGVGAKVAKLAGPIAGLAATAVTLKSVFDQFGEVDKIAKQARALNMSTEALVGLRHAGDLSGVSMEALDASLQRAARGGVDLLALSDQIKSIESPTERAKLAFDALGRQGQVLMPLLQEGSESIKAMAEEGAALKGFSLGDADKIEQANNAITQMKATFVGITRAIAIEVAPAITSIGSRAKVIAQNVKEFVRSMIPPFRAFASMAHAGFQVVGNIASRVFGGVSETGLSAWESITRGLVDWFSTAEYLFQKFESVVDVTINSLALGIVSWYEDWRFAFGTQIPGLLVAFGRFTSTVFGNLFKNIRDAMSKIWAFIKSGGRKGLDLAWTPLTTGFAESIQDLPDLAGREISLVELELQSRIKESAEALGEGLANHLDVRRRELLPDFTADFGGLDFKDFKLDDLEIGLADGLEKRLDDLAGPAAVERGSTEAFSSIFKNMRGESEQDKQLKIAESTDKKIAQMLAATKKIAANPPVQLIAGDI